MTRLDLQATAAVAVMAAFALAGPPARAQEATTTTTTESTTTTTAKPPTSATPEMIADAVARSKARHQRFLLEGVPEQFGSEGASFRSTAQ